ncbi:acetyl-CoA carboxylase biotin carboxyl carrier protein subunit [Algoriphagus sediminis]|uniref:Acetyl-CoA carboxylase biotin carboxyl carrier protein subunit n=1 Tax=Algoriphagus sediminis TaxID=3057113 RepID=A0ABT7YFU1_9BACT|nr:acetyl-CoA carboxylase biotin carboxyl carrier protein subunit [Algoriphagus sediminis]MDN3205384.1 acetyl-CoA carboxylase biotin carboxyl carrier protein subunit [Algoriphagus sediminis]
MSIVSSLEIVLQGMQVKIKRYLSDMYSVNIGEEKLTIEVKDQGYQINDELVQIDIKKLNDSTVHVIHKNKSYEVEFVRFLDEEKSMEIRIGNKIAQVSLKDKNDLLLEKLGLNLKSSAHISEIKAPMPGLILELKVKPGDEVKKGDVVLILEAMKMENIIKSPGDGVVKAVKAELGQSVEKNQVLIQF